MQLTTYKSRPPLSDFVEMFWHWQGRAPANANERALPTGTVELVINLHDENLRVYDSDALNGPGITSRSMICGAHSKYFVIDASPFESILGVHFKPGGAFPFLKLPAGELHNTHISLDTIWGTKAGELLDKLLAAGCLQDRFRILESALLEQTSAPLVKHPAVTFALQKFWNCSDMLTVADIVAQIGLSQRRFIEIFKREVGLRPKTYCRIRRFQQVLQEIEKRQQIEWVQVALDCGYYDQAHFNHDFQAFSGLSPTSYLQNRGEQLNHVPIKTPE